MMWAFMDNVSILRSRPCMLSVQGRRLWSCRPALMRSSLRPLTEGDGQLFLHVALLSAEKLLLTVLWRPVVPRLLTHHWP